MAGRKQAPLWRQAFLRALKRTGNVRTSAFEAGVDPGTAYDHRAKDAGFRAAWAGALKAFRAAEARKARGPRHHCAGGRPNRAGEELVLRRSKAGDRFVRAGAGRWSRRVEESFLDGLEQSGCVRTAAAAAGMSTNAFYNRRDKYPEFAARWDERIGRFREQLPGLINAAAAESMSPEQPDAAKRRGRARLPKLNAGEAIRVYAINENARAKERGPARRGGLSSRELRPQRSEEEEKEELVQKLGTLIGMTKRRRETERRAAGWTEVNGIWVPPGWTVQPPKLLPPLEPPAEE